MSLVSLTKELYLRDQKLIIGHCKEQGYDLQDTCAVLEYHRITMQREIGVTDSTPEQFFCMVRDIPEFRAMIRQAAQVTGMLHLCDATIKMAFDEPYAKKIGDFYTGEMRGMLRAEETAKSSRESQLENDGQEPR